MIKRIENLDSLLDSIIEIYEANEWFVYTKDPKSFQLALTNSSYLYGHFDGDKLVGLIRGLTDQISIHYIQDIIVAPSNHNQGIGSKLVNSVLEEYKDVRTHILLTDDEPSQLAFYKKLKFQNTRELKEDKLNAFVKFKDMELS